MFLQFVRVLAPWNVAIFAATLLGCYLPQLIVTSKWGLSASPKTPNPHKQQHEMLMSYMMAFSAGVCLAVSFLFQINGFRLSIGTSSSPDLVSRQCLTAGLLLAGTFLAFFVFEQLAALIQTWHSRRCGGIPPCAVEVASQPLEAASVVRTIAEHSGLKLEDMRCLSLTLESLRPESCETAQESHSVPLLDECRAFTPPRGQRECPVCNRRDLPPATLEAQTGSRLVLAFLLALFTIHSVAEGLGLGASACPTLQSQAGSTATVALAILLHKTLSAFAVGAALLREGISWAGMVTIAITFSLMSPLGSLLGYISCPTQSTDASVSAVFMLVAAGTFLFISLVEFLPNSFDEGSKGPGSISSRLIKTVLFILGSFAVFLAEIEAEY